MDVAKIKGGPVDIEKKRIFVIAGLLLAALVVVYLAYTFWPALAGDRPALMYFRADL